MVARPSSGAKPPTLPPEARTPYADELERLTRIGARPHLLYLLGDRQSGQTEDLTRRVQSESETVLNGGAFSQAWEGVLRPLGAWSYGVHHRVRDLFLIGDVAVATGLRYVSVLSVGRAGECDASSVRKAIEEAEPDIIVCAGCESVFWPLVGRLGLRHELLTTMYGEPIYYSLLESGERESVLLHFWDPVTGYHARGGHHYLFKLFLHACDALLRKRLIS